MKSRSTLSSELAQWRCQKNVSRSTRGLRADTMRPTQSSTISVLPASRSIGWLFSVAGGPTGAPCGVSRSQSIASPAVFPVQVVRSAAVGPKPARQKRRSTISSVMHRAPRGGAASASSSTAAASTAKAPSTAPRIPGWATCALSGGGRLSRRRRLLTGRLVALTAIRRCTSPSAVTWLF